MLNTPDTFVEMKTVIMTTKALEERIEAIKVRLGLEDDEAFIRRAIEALTKVTKTSQRKILANRDNGARPPKPGSRPRGRPPKNESL